MQQFEFTRRLFMQSLAATTAVATAGRISDAWAAEGLKLWAAPIHKVGAKDWSAMEAQGGIKIAYTTKSARADEAIQKMVVGDGNKLFDALTDNGGGMEDALASQKAIVPLDTSKIPNWKNILPIYKEGGLAANTISHDGKVYATPMISNADSMAYDYQALGFHPDSWGVMFDSQFKGRVALQNDFGPTLTNMAIYLKESGKIDIEKPSDMKPEEVKAVCQFLIDFKKKGQFRTFWDGFQNGVGILASGEVLMSSCWEPIQIVANKKTGDKADIRYGTMKEGHQTWNNVIMLSKGGRERGMDDLYYRGADDRCRRIHQGQPQGFPDRRAETDHRCSQQQERPLWGEGQRVAERVPDAPARLSGLVGTPTGRLSVYERGFDEYRVAGRPGCPGLPGVLASGLG
jgi:spermidine/putrescine-binding protein